MSDHVPSTHKIAHYIFVRRDLPIGVLAAMVTHAAGESAPLYQDENGHFRGATAVVLEAKNEADLHKVASYLWSYGLSAVEIYESHGPYANQLMAIGLVPLERTEKIREILGEFQTLKSCLTCVDSSKASPLNSSNPNYDKDTQTAQETADVHRESDVGLDSRLTQSGC